MFILLKRPAVLAFGKSSKYSSMNYKMRFIWGLFKEQNKQAHLKSPEKTPSAFYLVHFFLYRFGKLESTSRRSGCGD